MRRWLPLILLLVVSSAFAQTTPNRDILGAHDLSVASSPLHGTMSSACLYCHVPHSGTGKGPLWGQTFSSQTYTLYNSTTLQNEPQQPVIGEVSSLCLSCHDGTVAPGLSVPYGKFFTTGTMENLVGAQLERSHPFSLRLPLKDAPHLVATLAASGATSDSTGSVKLINGNVECSSCHNPHNQFLDKNSSSFLVRDGKAGAICLSCHETQPRTVNSQSNPLATWPSNIHETSVAAVKANSGWGNYATVGDFACASCHAQHNAGGASGLLRNPTGLINIDTTSQSCYSCHGGGDKLVQALPNVFTEMAKRGHPYASDTNQHSVTEPTILMQNRHTTCVDCHDSHGSKQVMTFSTPPGIRPSQNGARGVSSDGTLLAAASQQYETCLRCHGTSTGKLAPESFGYLPSRLATGGDQLNLIPQFGSASISAHPVMRDRNSPGTQPSLLSAMWNIDGTTAGRLMGTRLFCTDCHNSDVNREFGGIGPNGPHGSVNDHILERRYVASEVAAGTFPTGGPGSPIINPNPNPPTSPSSGGPYSLCAKCHDLTNVLSDVTFPKHSKHVNELGISCSVCHSAHGVPAGGSGLNGQRLVNFDIKVVAPNAGVISYSGTSCTLRCHMADHTSSGVTKVVP
ncbi:MAG TPA: cytochrome c3 family protein [Terriglobales bacterium]|nr:cytochrome c3 family protein [Terriglobales bacterium]